MGRQGFRKFLKNHKRDRGMDFDHDVHDWLDGYPYEAALITEVEKEMQAVEFKAERVFGEPIPHPGAWSSANDEYVGRLFGVRPASRVAAGRQRPQGCPRTVAAFLR